MQLKNIFCDNVLMLQTPYPQFVMHTCTFLVFYLSNVLKIFVFNACVTQGFGQWSTAQFSNSEQQQKFLRLMGGFKKGFQPAAASTGRANMAMGKEAQQQLQRGLLGEFDRAHSRRIDFNSRGAGLGFTAPSNKKFSIDINASQSIRFDD